MATLILGAVGNSVGGPFGQLLGTVVGASIDSLWLPGTGAGKVLDLSVQTSLYGQPLPRVYGPQNRVSGNLFWSSGLVQDTGSLLGGGGGKGGAASSGYTYHIDAAIGLCRGPIVGVGRIWADGKLFRDAGGVQKSAQSITTYLGTETQMPDPTMQAAIGASACPAHRGLAYVVFQGLELAAFGNRLPNFTFEVIAHSSATVATVLTELCGIANVQSLDAARADFCDLRGFTINKITNVRDAIAPLRTAFFFDGSEIDGELQFFLQDASPIARAPRDDLGAHPFGTDRPSDYDMTRHADLELPRQVSVQHLDPARDYQQNTQRARRSTLNSTADLAVDLPISFAVNEAKAIAERRLSLAQTARTDFTVQLPIAYLHVEPGHKLVIQTSDGVDRTLHVKSRELRLPGSIAFSCDSDGAATLNKTATASPAPVPVQIVALPGPTTLLLLDLPLMRDVDDMLGIYVGAGSASTGWTGALLDRSTDGGLNYTQLLAINVGATIGTTIGVLGTTDPHYWDNANTVDVVLADTRRSLAGVSAMQVLNGSNVAAIGGEIVQFTTAALIAPATYRLSGLLRGRKGSEDQVGVHAVGDRFILLTGPAVYRATLGASEVGQTRSYKAVAFGTLLADAPVVPFTFVARSAKPLSPSQLSAVRDGSGNITLAWIRRTRLDGPWVDLVDVPLGEASEAYSVDIVDPSGTVKRTIGPLATATTPYPAAQQVTDFGAAQPSVRVRVYQLSARVGRGFPTDQVV